MSEGSLPLPEGRKRRTAPAPEPRSTRLIRLGVLLRAHRRARTLDIVLSELERYNSFPGLEVHILTQIDRPTEDVQDILRKHANPDFMRFTSAPKPMVADKENFLSNQNAHLDEAERRLPRCDWFFTADDDRWFEPQRITEELPRALSNPDISLWDCRSLFMWDEPTKFNAARHHLTPLLWRHIPRFRFSGRRMMSVPDALHDQYILTGAHGHMQTPLLDYGSYTSAERRLLYDIFTAAGKRDDYIDSLLAPPRLLTFPDDAVSLGFATPGPWTDLYAEPR